MDVGASSEKKGKRAAEYPAPRSTGVSARGARECSRKTRSSTAPIKNYKRRIITKKQLMGEKRGWDMIILISNLREDEFAIDRDAEDRRASEKLLSGLKFREARWGMEIPQTRLRRERDGARS